MRLTLKQKRAIVDRFMAGESMTYIATHDDTGVYNPRGLLNYKIIEDTVRWAHKSKTERRRVWRKLTGVKR